MEVSNIDKQNMHKVIAGFPDQLITGLDLAQHVKVKGPFENVVVCGLGGSALPADIMNSLGIPLYVHKDYNLPPVTNEKSLVICISYSGNTEETISALQEAIKRKSTIVGVANGGAIETLCQQHSIPFVKIPSGVQPRCATGYIFSALITVLANSGMTQDLSSEILETAQKLKDLNLSLEKEGKILAKKLVKKIPIVYGTNKANSDAIARIWKIKFNENTKIPAFYNYFPELNHNEMVGYEGLKRAGMKNACVIMLKDPSAHPRTQKRIELTAQLIKKAGAKVEIILLKEGNDIFKIFSSLLLGDWTSYYLALEYKIDPTPVKTVEEFKKMMQE